MSTELETFEIEDKDPNINESAIIEYVDVKSIDKLPSLGIQLVIGHNEEDIQDMQNDSEENGTEYEIHEFEIILTKQNLIDMLNKIEEYENE